MLGKDVLDKGYWEVFVGQVAPGEQTEAWRDLIKDLTDRKLISFAVLHESSISGSEAAHEGGWRLPARRARRICRWHSRYAPEGWASHLAATQTAAARKSRRDCILMNVVI